MCYTNITCEYVLILRALIKYASYDQEKIRTSTIIGLHVSINTYFLIFEHENWKLTTSTINCVAF